jgi:hypothetical protein
MGLHGAELGADLAHLYRDGADLLPTVAADFDAAVAGPDELAEYAFIRDSQPGLGVSGPYAEISGLASTLSEKISDVATTLYALGHNIVATAQDLARVESTPRPRSPRPPATWAT